MLHNIITTFQAVAMLYKTIDIRSTDGNRRVKQLWHYGIEETVQ